MVMVQLLQFTWACISRWIDGSAVAAMVWWTDAISSAIDTTAKIGARLQAGPATARPLALRPARGVQSLRRSHYTACRQATS